MNPGFWGRNAWDFFHQVPWNYPDEILSPKVLSCPSCSASAIRIEERKNMIESITKLVPFPDGSKRRIVTRGSIAKWIYDFHNEVNEKLGKPKFGETWEDSIQKRPKWQKNMFTFFMTVMWVYPKDASWEKQVDYDYFFSILVPEILKYTLIGKFYKKFLEKHPFSRTLGEKERMFKWIYQMRKYDYFDVTHFKRHADKICGSSWVYEDVCTFMEAVEARGNCNVSPNDDDDDEGTCK